MISSGSEEAVVAGVDRGMGPVAQAQAGEDAGDVVLHRALGQEQARGDLAVGRAACYQAQDIDLAGGQCRPWLAGETLTQADISAVCAYDFVRLVNAGLVPEGRYPHLEAVIAASRDLPAFAAAPV